MTLNNDLRAAAPRPRERIITDTLNSGDDYVHYAILEVLLDIRGELNEMRGTRFDIKLNEKETPNDNHPR